MAAYSGMSYMTHMQKMEAAQAKEDERMGIPPEVTPLSSPPLTHPIIPIHESAGYSINTIFTVPSCSPSLSRSFAPSVSEGPSGEGAGCSFNTIFTPTNHLTHSLYLYLYVLL